MSYDESKDSHFHTRDGDVIFTKDNYSKIAKAKLTKQQVIDKLKQEPAP